MVKTADSLHGACKDFERDMVLYYYQECTGTERQRVESHLESCAPCRAFLQELRSLLTATVKSDEPSPEFWQSYSREMRAKLVTAKEKSAWWRAMLSLFRPWPVPAVATAMIVALAVTLTLTNGRWSSDSPEAPEVQEMASNADFFESLDFLDSMDLLEAVEAKETQNGETSAHL